VLLCEALESTREDLAITAFEQLFRERACHKPSAPTMAFPSPVQTACSTSPGSPSGGSGSASRSSASSQASRSRTDVTSACI
jgi:hypothetical protein